MRTISDSIRISEIYKNYLEVKGISFDGQGVPIIPKVCYLNKWPKGIIPVDRINSKSISNKQDKLVCFYCKDKYIYPRFDKLFDEIPKYKEFMGVIGPDITVTDDMDIEMQKFTIYLNLLFMSVLAVQGVKVVCNTRIGAPETIKLFNAIPREVMCASGTFGCEKTKKEEDLSYISKILSLRPSKLVVYGKRDEVMFRQLDRFGIRYRQFNDFYTEQKLCRHK